MKRLLITLLIIPALLLTAPPVTAFPEDADASPAIPDAPAAAEEKEATVSAEGLNPLPMDDYRAYGPAPDESCFRKGRHIYSGADTFDDWSYIDRSIAVYVWREWRDDCCFNVARIRIADPSQLRTALERDNIKLNNYVSEIAKAKNAVIACGGEFLAHPRNKSSYCVRMGVTLRDKGIRAHDALIIDRNGDFHITNGFSAEKLEELEESGIEAVNVFNFGPVLVLDGEQQYHRGEKAHYTNTSPNSPNPRTAIGQLGPLEYLMVVTDGREVQSPLPDGGTRQHLGCTIVTLTEFMASYHCIQAYNLDGGNSTAMYFDGGTFSTSVRRGVTDIIYFATLADPGN